MKIGSGVLDIISNGASINFSSIRILI
ncbi:hypothetical protein ABLV94_14735 [Staphylococcus sp. Mo2-7]